jgi:hypothetical protein
MLICFVRLKTSVSGGMHVPCGPPTVSCFANAWKHVPAGEANNMICLEIYQTGEQHCHNNSNMVSASGRHPLFPVPGLEHCVRRCCLEGLQDASRHYFTSTTLRQRSGKSTLWLGNDRRLSFTASSSGSERSSYERHCFAAMSKNHEYYLFPISN